MIRNKHWLKFRNKLFFKNYIFLLVIIGFDSCLIMFVECLLGVDAAIEHNIKNKPELQIFCTM